MGVPRLWEFQGVFHGNSMGALQLLHDTRNHTYVAESQPPSSSETTNTCESPFQKAPAGGEKSVNDCADKHHTIPVDRAACSEDRI